MRHVSRTKGKFTHDEWNNLLHLFNVSHFSSLRWTKFFSFGCITMAKRIQEQREGERVVSKSRPAGMNMSSYFIATSSSAASSPILSKSLGMSGASGKPDSRLNLEASSFNAASTSQVRLKDAYLGGLKEEQQGDLSREKEETADPESEPWYYKLVARPNESCGKPLAGEAAESISSAFHNKEATRNNCLQLSTPTNQFTNAVFSVVWEIYGKYHDESMGDLNVHLAIWRHFKHKFPSAKKMARIHLNRRRNSLVVR